MILPDHELRRRLSLPVAEGGIRVEPVALSAEQPSSIDLRLGDTVLTYGRGEVVDPVSGKRPVPMSHDIQGKAWFLMPGHFAVMATHEWVEVPDTLVAVVDGKSSWARDGLQVHAAGYVDPGYRGNVTLELVNLGPLTIVLRPGLVVAQIRFHMLLAPAERPYGSDGLGSHYQGSRGPVASRLGMRS